MTDRIDKAARQGKGPMRFKVIDSLLGIAFASTIASSFASCRVAVCFSGAIRSFVHPTVHISIKTNLIEAIEAGGCEVDVFAYATLADTSGRRKEWGVFTPNASDIETALAVLAPTRLVWHQEQVGVIPNSCPTTAATPSSDGHRFRDPHGLDLSTWQTVKPDKGIGLYWQLYKALAAFRMAVRQEKRRGSGFSYDWIIRARFDVAWIRPFPPLSSFSRDSVWFNRHYWPMSDQVALVPRDFADSFFAAISAFYACDGQSWPPTVSWWQPGCRQPFEEAVLFRYLHAAGVPYRVYFMFEYVITRGNLGGVCVLGEVTFAEACNLLEFSGEFRPPITSLDCTVILAHWADFRCRALLPAKGMGDARRSETISMLDPRAWERLVEISSQTQQPAEMEVATEAAVQIGQGNQGDGGSSDTTTYTTIPTVEDIGRLHSKLILLRDAIREQPKAEGNDSIFDNFEAMNNSTRSSRWDSWQKIPPSAVYSSKQCPISEFPGFSPFPGLSPHIMAYYTMGTPLIKELAHALRCFVSSLIDKTQDEKNDLDGSSCKGIRPLEMVMIDISLHTEELGMCTADGTLGLSAVDHMRRFSREPAAHCKGYGKIDEQQ